MNKPDYLPKILKQAKVTRPKKREWLKAFCPFCGKEYEYLPDYKPKTCGMFECLYAMANNILKKRGKS